MVQESKSNFIDRILQSQQIDALIRTHLMLLLLLLLLLLLFLLLAVESNPSLANGRKFHTNSSSFKRTALFLAGPLKHASPRKWTLNSTYNPTATQSLLDAHSLII